MMKGKQIYLVGWLAAATVLLTLVSLTAEPLHPQAMAMSHLQSMPR